MDAAAPGSTRSLTDFRPPLPSPDLPMIAIAIPSHYSHRPLLRSEEMSSHELIMHFDFVSKNDFNAVENHKYM